MFQLIWAIIMGFICGTFATATVISFIKTNKTSDIYNLTVPRHIALMIAIVSFVLMFGFVSIP